MTVSVLFSDILIPRVPTTLIPGLYWPLKQFSIMVMIVLTILIFWLLSLSIVILQWLTLWPLTDDTIGICNYDGDYCYSKRGSDILWWWLSYCWYYSDTIVVSPNTYLIYLLLTCYWRGNSVMAHYRHPAPLFILTVPSKRYITTFWCHSNHCPWPLFIDYRLFWLMTCSAGDSIQSCLR